MYKLKFQIRGITVTLVETEEDLVLVTEPECDSKAQEALESYLEEEGIIEAFLIGDTEFGKVTAESILQK